MSPHAHTRPVPPLLLALAVAGLVMLLVTAGVLFLRWRRAAWRAPVSEVKSHLKGLFTAERAHLQEVDTYSEDLARVGFAPGPGNRYTYFSAATGRSLEMSERSRPGAPYQVVPADPGARGYRGTFTSFAETGCPLTPVRLRDGTVAGLGVSVTREGSEPIFVGAAAANIDGDATVDCWSIATVDRVAPDGSRILAGEPYNELNDVLH